MTILFTPASEPLGHSAPITHRALYPLLGVPLVVGSNSSAVLEAAERSFGRWRSLPAAQVADAPPLRLNLFVHQAGGVDAATAMLLPFVQRLWRPYYLTASGESIATANLETGEAVGFVTPELLASDLHFRYNLLECLALALVTQRDRYPVHAAAVVRGERALLLVGASAVGKSTLSYACVRAGWQLLAEDAVYVSLGQNLLVAPSVATPSVAAVWGAPWRIHLLPDAPRHFPELVGIAPQIQANGKLKLALDLTTLSDLPPRTSAAQARVCLLSRRAGAAASAEPVAPAEAIAALTQGLEPGFDLSRRAHAVAAALAGRRAWRVTVGSDLAQAVEMLAQVAEA
jgi:hypothetical protein